MFVNFAKERFIFFFLAVCNDFNLFCFIVGLVNYIINGTIYAFLTCFFVNSKTKTARIKRRTIIAVIKIGSSSVCSTTTYKTKNNKK